MSWGDLTVSYAERRVTLAGRPVPLTVKEYGTLAELSANAGRVLTYEWPHSLGDIVSALIDAGLRIEFLHEFPFTCYQAYPVMERGDDGWWRFPKHNESFPQMFSIRATR